MLVWTGIYSYIVFFFDVFVFVLGCRQKIIDFFQLILSFDVDKCILN